MRLSVVTWNVHGCVGGDGRFNPDRTAEVLSRYSPDIALLQEVGDSRGIHPPIDQATQLSQLLGVACAVGITMPREPYGYGNVILSRQPILDSETIDLSVWRREPRLCLSATIGEVPLRVHNVHLGLSPGERRRQLQRLLPLLSKKGPIVLGGDFNDVPRGLLTRTLERLLWDVTAKKHGARTFPARRPLFRLDRLYVSSEVRVISWRVDYSEHSRAASDHLPLVAEVEY
jgi:endonuclease/exonuclease/phosphatase family metal-dependent hydrolase